MTQSKGEQGRVIVYAAIIAVSILLYPILSGLPWLGNGPLHTNMELVATLLALLVGSFALVGYYSRKEPVILFIGAGFIGTAFLDGYHTVVTSAVFAPFLPSNLGSLIPWSWTASRIFLSLMLVLSWLVWQAGEKKWP